MAHEKTRGKARCSQSGISLSWPLVSFPRWDGMDCSISRYSSLRKEREREIRMGIGIGTLMVKQHGLS